MDDSYHYQEQPPPIGYTYRIYLCGVCEWLSVIATFVEAMSKAVDDIVREWNKRNEPLKLPEKKGTKLESLPDHTIRDLYQTIQMIGGVQFNPLFQNSKAESYFNRIKSEYEARFEK
jgi:hypothetical protein